MNADDADLSYPVPNVKKATCRRDITRTSDGAPLSGVVQALQAGLVKNSATTAANGAYMMSNVVTGRAGRVRHNNSGVYPVS